MRKSLTLLHFILDSFMHNLKNEDMSQELNREEESIILIVFIYVCIVVLLYFTVLL